MDVAEDEAILVVTETHLEVAAEDEAEASKTEVHPLT